jgi:hypothetical protein
MAGNAAEIWTRQEPITSLERYRMKLGTSPDPVLTSLRYTSWLHEAGFRLMSLLYSGRLSTEGRSNSERHRVDVSTLRCIKGPIHDQSCCAKLFCATQVCPFTIKSISTIHDQSCCTTHNVAQHDWSCMSLFKEVPSSWMIRDRPCRSLCNCCSFQTLIKRVNTLLFLFSSLHSLSPCIYTSALFICFICGFYNDSVGNSGYSPQRPMIEWQWMLNWKGCGRKLWWSNRCTAPAFFWRDWRESRKTSVIRDPGRDLNRASPKYRSGCYRLSQIARFRGL